MLARFGWLYTLDTRNQMVLKYTRSALSTISQSPDSIAGFFTCIKRLWDEKDSLSALRPCSFGFSTIRKYESDHHLIQFLMALDDSFSSARGTFLMSSPLPSIDEAYSILVHNETQREVLANTQVCYESRFFSECVT